MMSDDDCWDVLLFDDFFACVWIWRMLIWLDDWSWNQQNAGYVCFPAQWGYDDCFQVRWKRWFNKFYGLYGDPHSTNAIAPEEQLAYKKRNCILDVVLYLSLTAHTQIYQNRISFSVHSSPCQDRLHLIFIKPLLILLIIFGTSTT